MRINPAIFTLLFLACNQAGKKETPVDTTAINTDTIPNLSITPGAGSVNARLANEPGNWRLMTDSGSGWTKDALEYFVYPQRRADPDYPYISRGDYNCDGHSDLAALVTDGTGSQVKLLFIYGNSSRLDWWKEDMQGAALKNMKKQDFGAMRDEKEIRVSLQCDAVEAEWFEKATQVIFWNEKQYENVWTGD